MEIEILGVKLTQKEFPKLYQWAEINPTKLEETILRMVDKGWGGKKEMIPLAFATLEQDLQHG